MAGFSEEASKHNVRKSESEILCMARPLYFIKASHQPSSQFNDSRTTPCDDRHQPFSSCHSKQPIIFLHVPSSTVLSFALFILLIATAKRQFLNTIFNVEQRNIISDAQE